MTSVKHRTKQLAIERLIMPEMFKGPKPIWPREMKLIKQLAADKPDDAFWNELNVGYQMPSLAHFKTPEGAAILERHWRMHQLAAKSTPTPQKEIDNDANTGTISDTMPSVPPKQSALEWASS